MSSASTYADVVKFGKKSTFGWSVFPSHSEPVAESVAETESLENPVIESVKPEKGGATGKKVSSKTSKIVAKFLKDNNLKEDSKLLKLFFFKV